MEIAAKVGGILAEFQAFKFLTKILPLPAMREVLKADERVQEYGRVAVTNAKGRDMSKANVFSRLIAQWDIAETEKRGKVLSEYEIAFEAGGFIVAGSGTTAVTLTYLVWAVLCHPDIQTKLEAVVSKLESDYTDADLEKLPYLNAVVDETLRLYGAAPGSLPRRPPPGGVVLAGYPIPQDTTVSSQAYSLHRNESVYQNALW